MERGESKMQESNVWPLHLFQGNATAHIKDKALTFCKGDGIDFGAGEWCLPGAIPVDHSTYFGIEDFDPNSLDFVYSSHCLEHIRAWKETLRELISKLKPNGIIFLYLPHKDSPWTNWRKHKWAPTINVIAAAFSKMEIRIVELDSGPDDYQSFFMVGRKQVPGASDSNESSPYDLYRLCSKCGARIYMETKYYPRCATQLPKTQEKNEGHEN